MHPEEYIESEWTEDREDDEELLGEILLALSYIYDRRMEGSVHMCAPHCAEDQVDMFLQIPPFDKNITLRERAVDRLDTWRQEYAQGLFDSGLLKWMTSQPVVAIVADALVVHGGVSERLLNYLESVAAKEGVDVNVNVADMVHASTNVPFQAFFEEELGKVQGANQIEARLKGGHVLELIMDMIQHRGYFGSTGCKEVNNVLVKMDKGLNRIVVGHTPHDYAMELCEGKLLASDSSLSRPFRAHGNMYCPLRTSLEKYRGTGTCQVKYKDECEGSISRMTRASAQDPWPTNMDIFKFHELVANDNVQTAATGLGNGDEL